MKKKEEQSGVKMQNSAISTEEIIAVATGIQQELENYIDPVKREYLPNFLRPEKGSMVKGISSWGWLYRIPAWWQSVIRMNLLR